MRNALRDNPCCPGSRVLWSSLPSCLQVDRKTAFFLPAMSALRSHSAGLCGCSWPATCIPHQQGWRELREEEEEEAPQVQHSCGSPHVDATALARWRRGQQPRDPPTCCRSCQHSLHPAQYLPSAPQARPAVVPGLQTLHRPSARAGGHRVLGQGVRL